jgi:dTMP kinase
MSGSFIVFEGGECSGKSTQSNLLFKFLQQENIPVELIKNPGTTPLGKSVREILLNNTQINLTPKEELFLYLTGHSSLVRDCIRPALEEGKVIISDRWTDSTLAYQGYGSGLDLDMVKKFCDYATDGLRPDIGIFLDIPHNIMLERIKDKTLDKMEGRGVEFHKRVNDGFRKISKSRDYLKKFDGTGTIEEIFSEIREVVLKELKI